MWEGHVVVLRMAVAFIGTETRGMIRDLGHGKRVELGNCKALNVVSFYSDSKLGFSEHQSVLGE
jgi:hypothetical protein